MKRIFSDLSRLVMAGLFVALGVVVCWRALNYSNPVDASMIGPLFCVVLAIVLTMTGVILALRGGDFETGPEQTPARQN